MAQVQIFIRKVLWKNAFFFPTAIWLSSRLFVWVAMLLLAPLLKVPIGGTHPSFGWGVFYAWDSLHYLSIATSGYEYRDDGEQHNIAFFPLFPIIVREVMNLGIPFEVAGTLVNNLAFCATLYCLYFWVEKHHGSSAARWVSAVAAWCPMSLFGSVIYTEGLYLFLSTAALKAFDQKQYRWSAIWGAMATATRPTGLALLPAFAIAAVKQRRSPTAYIVSIATATGVLLFSLFCAIHFGDPLAFIKAQRGWRPSFGFNWQNWLEMLVQIAIGTSNWEDSSIQSPLHPLVLFIIVVTGCLLWRFRQRRNFLKVVGGFYYALILFLLIVADDWFIYNLLNAVTILGGSYVLWRLRTQLTLVAFIYGFCGIGLLLASGSTISLSRLSYGIVSLSVALGLLLSRHPRWGYLILGCFAVLLSRLAVRFAQKLWVG
ncbi:MAG: mannosyltransferase family protein [Rhizonema sp. NSF051]|nr:mannosyltransferase family protein [Rhizonema sp. NSF051]